MLTVTENGDFGKCKGINMEIRIGRRKVYWQLSKTISKVMASCRLARSGCLYVVI